MTVALIPRHAHFADYRLRGYRGGGGFSDVYEAVAPDGTRVAIKVLRTGPATGDERRRRFERERAILDALDVRRVARLIRAELDADPPWIASEYVDGPTLREAVEQRGPMTPDEVAALVGSLARTLAELHAAGIAHRDLTPNNVLLGAAGPVIIDFGSAREDAVAAAGSVLSVATPGFASPEALAKGVVGTAADVHALARLAEYASSGADATGVGWPGLVPGQWAALSRCLATDPATRPTAIDVAKVFAAGELPERLRSAGYAPVRLRALPRRVRPLTAVLMAAAAAVATAGVAVLALGGAETRTYDDVVGAAEGDLPVGAAPAAAGWLATLPAIEGWDAEYVRPVDLERVTPALAIESHRISPSAAPGVLEISAEVLGRDVVDELASLALDDARDVALGELPLLAARFAQMTRAFADLAVPRSCRLDGVDAARIVPDGRSPRVRLAAATSGCVAADGVPMTAALLADAYPAQGAFVVASLAVGEGGPDVGAILDATSGVADPIVRDVAAGGVPLVAGDPTALVFAGESRFLRRAVALPAGRALRLAVGARVESRLALVAVPTSAPDAVVGLGALEGLDAGETWWFDNPSSEDWTVVVELDERAGPSSLEVELSLDDAQGELATLEVFAAGGVVPGTPSLTDPTDVAIVLPRGPGAARPVEYARVAEVALPVPSGWIVTSEANARGAIVLNANPVSSYLAFLEDDSPQLDVVSERLGELTDALPVEEWMFTDRIGDCAGAREWQIAIGAVRLWWKAFAGCAIRDASFDGGDARLRAQQVPIVKFGLSTRYDTDGDGREDYDIGVLRGTFVPETRADLGTWRDLVDAVREQADAIAIRESRRCIELIGADACG